MKIPVNFYIVFGVFVVVHAHQGRQTRHGPMEGGYLARKGEFPFAVAIKNKHYEYCTGMILSPKHVITEAWCIDDPETMKIVAGCEDYNSITCQEYSISTVSFHPNYTDVGVNDVAIITLQNALRLGKAVKTIKVSRRFIDDKTTAIALGWDPWSSQLRWNDVKVLHHYECDANWGWGEPGNVICTLPAELIYEKAGDFGFSLIAYGNLVGIPVESGNSYDVYQRLSKYVDWIEAVTRK